MGDGNIRTLGAAWVGEGRKEGMWGRPAERDRVSLQFRTSTFWVIPASVINGYRKLFVGRKEDP